MIILDAASEGTHVILGMLIVACIFLGTVVLGELTNAVGHRRKARRAARRRQY